MEQAPLPPPESGQGEIEDDEYVDLSESEPTNVNSKVKRHA